LLKKSIVEQDSLHRLELELELFPLRQAPWGRRAIGFASQVGQLPAQLSPVLELSGREAIPIAYLRRQSGQYLDQLVGAFLSVTRLELRTQFLRKGIEDGIEEI
jgi:hypothetical protein